VYGDEGGGFDLVRQALRASLRMEEGWGPSTSLRGELLAASGASDANDLLHRFYTTDWPRPRIAALSKLVDHAAIAGDAVAIDLLHLAAQHQANFVGAVRSQLFRDSEPARVAYIGGVFRSTRFRERFRRLVELADGVTCGPPEMGPAAGAAEAYRQAGQRYTVGYPEIENDEDPSCSNERGRLAAEPDWQRVTRSLSRLQTYIRIKTINLPAVTKAAVLQLSEEGWLRAFFSVAAKTGKVNLVVLLPGKDRSKKPLLLLNHFDTVPVDAKAWDIDPFGGLLKDGAIWGRGALDMKGIGVQHLTALMELKRAGVAPSRDIVMLTTADEESGGDFGIQWMIANHFADIDVEYVLDEGGFGTGEILAPKKLVFGIAAGEKQVSRLRVRATGTAAHGSQPIPDNANDRPLRALQQILTYDGRGKAHPIVEEMRTNIGGTFADTTNTPTRSRRTPSP
jgi:hypothetical protein